MPRSYPPEFRRKVLDLVEAGRPIKQVAELLGVSDQTIYNWRKQHLIDGGWTAPDRLVTRSGSAGSLLMGAVANLDPAAFRGILADVAFVDAVKSILDASRLPTVVGWEEWGNPIESAEMYQHMKSYSPYENVTAVGYPAILARTSLSDTRVGYHEPAQRIARLRATATGGQFLLKTEIEAGHGGQFERYDAWNQEAFRLAWVIAVATGM